MLQSATILLSYYPGDFFFSDLENHIDDLLDRFQNRALKDTVFRVGQDLPRKLGIDDRFAGVIQMAKNKGLEYDRIVKAMAYGFFFRKTNELGQPNIRDERFAQVLTEKGVEEVLVSLCGFDSKKDQILIDELKVRYMNIKQTSGQ